MGIFAACNHPVASQSVSVLDALRMHTINCAKLSFDENTRGTLTIGKRADFVVLDQNPLAMPAEKLNTLNVEALYLQGEPYKGRQGRSIGSLVYDAVRNQYR